MPRSSATVGIILLGVTTRRSRSDTSWRGGLTVRQFVEQVRARVTAHEVVGHAAGLSYYFLFALFPTLLFLTALVGLLPVPLLMDQLMGYLVGVLPPDAASLIVKTLGEVRTGASGGLLSLGAIAALWSASGGMLSIISRLNRAYELNDERPWWKRRLIAIALTCGFSVFTLVAILLLVFGERIGEATAALLGLGPQFTQTWKVLQWPAVTLCALAGVGLVHYVAPVRRRPWASLVPGSVFAVMAWLVLSFALRLYVGYVGSYNATYGSIGGVILLMLWLYWVSLALLVGAEINAVVAQSLPHPPGVETLSARLLPRGGPREQLPDR
jgi:membrane protein